MTPRHVVLVLAAVAVFGFGVYLYLAASATPPAVANVRQRSPEPRPPREDRDEAPKEAAKAPEARRGGTTKRISEQVKAAGAPATGGTAPPELGHEAAEFKKDEVMASANKAYDRGDFDEAMSIAKKVLANDPANTRMLRIMVSASCILGDGQVAQTNYALLPRGGKDRLDMRTRCDRYGVSFSE